MRSLHCRIDVPFRAQEPLGTIALAPAAAAPLLRRSAAGTGLGPRRAPLARRLAAADTGQPIPSESRIVFRAGAVAWR
jgi:hypothetical protein